MCPIEVTPGVPYYMSGNKKTLRDTEATIRPEVIVGMKYVVPADKGDECIVKVDGYPHLPGGTITSSRFTPDDREDCFTLTVDDDPTLPMSGLSGVVVDKIHYDAVDVLVGPEILVGRVVDL
jgi:hypothetical protein